MDKPNFIAAILIAIALTSVHFKEKKYNKNLVYDLEDLAKKSFIGFDYIKIESTKTPLGSQLIKKISSMEFHICEFESNCLVKKEYKNNILRFEKKMLINYNEENIAKKINILFKERMMAKNGIV